MPIYEYECPRCGRFDALQKMSDPALDVHDKCGSPVRRLMSASSFAFKGAGFYVNDYCAKSSATIGADRPEKSDACASCPAGKSAA